MLTRFTDLIIFYSAVLLTFSNHMFEIQTRFQKSWDTVQIVNKKGMQ